MAILVAKIRRALSLILVLALLFNVINPVVAFSASNEAETDFIDNPFAVFSTGEKPLVFNVEKADINGSIYSDSDIIAEYSNGVNISDSMFFGGKTEGNIVCKGASNPSIKSELPDLLYFLECSAEYENIIMDDAVISEKEIDLSEDSLKVSGTLCLNKPHLTNFGYITAEDSITYHVSPSVNENSNVILTSENGDIIINGSNITIDGLIYAPNGKIQVNAKNVTINGAVYGKEIEFNATNLSVNYSEETVSKVIPQIIADAGDDKSVYVDEAALLEGTVNYKEAKSKWELISGPADCAIENVEELSTNVHFTVAGTYVFKLTCSMDLINGEDTVTVEVKPAPCKTFTSTYDFDLGENKNLETSGDELKLGTPADSESEGYSKEYTTANPSGIKVENTVSKSAVVSAKDSVSIDYNLSGYGSVETGKGVDFFLLIDNSGSMYGSYLTNAQEAAKEIISYMGENDRYAVSSLNHRDTDFTNNVNVLTKAINNIKSYLIPNTCSDFGNGLKIALDYFEQESNEERQKYIILLTDGENFNNDDVVAYEQAQRALDNNVKIYSLAMNSQRLNLQNVAIMSKGIYIHCPDGASIKEFMLKSAQNIFNGAGRNISLKTTVLDESYVDMGAMNPLPSEMNKNDDGSVTLIWNLDEMEIDQAEKFSLSLNTSVLTGDAYKTLTKDTVLSYYDKDGNGQIIYLDDIILSENDRKTFGTWSAVYDSNRENCNWTSVSFNSLYRGNSDINVYVSASNDASDFPEREKVTNYEELKDVVGRYIKVETELLISEDGATPVLYDLTVTSESNVKEISKEKLNTTEIIGRNEVPVNKPLSLYLNIERNDVSVDTIVWSVSGEGEVEISTDGELLKTFVFRNAGEYTITAKTISGETYYESSYSVKVSEAESMESIGDGSETVDYNLKMQVTDLPEVVEYKDTYDLSVSFSDVSQLAWMRVVYNNSSTDTPLSISNNYTASIRFSSNKNKMHYVTVQAFDWAGNMIEEKFEVFVDDENPKASLHISKYSPIFCGDTIIISPIASDNYAVESVRLTIDNEEITLDEDGTFIFVPETPGNYDVTVYVTDKVGKTAYKSTTLKVKKDVTAPSIWIGSTKQEFYLGLSSTLTFKIADGETGLKSYDITLNGEEIKLNDENQYLFVPEAAGTYEFECTALDNRDNKKIQRYTITVLEDTVKPSVGIVVPKAKVNAGGEMTVRVITSDNVKVETLEFFVNGVKTDLDENNQYVFHALEEHIGTITFSATATDTAGNQKTVEEKITVQERDITAPYIFIHLSPEISLGSSIEYMTVNVYDDIEVSKVEILVNGETVELTATSNYYFDTSDLFTYDVVVIATDTSGNQSVKTASTTVVDTTPPQVSITTTQDIYDTEETFVYTVKIFDRGRLKDLYVDLNGEKIEVDVTTNFTITVDKPQAGNYALYVIATDESGNTHGNIKSVVVKDTIAPKVVLTSDQSKYTVGENPVLELDISDNVGISGVTAKLNDAEIEYIDGKLLLPEIWEVGTYKITVTATDAEGNQTTQEVQFEIEAVKDNVIPTIKNITLEPSIIEVGSTMKIGLEATDDSGSVDVAVTANGNACIIGSDGKYVYSPSQSGEYTIVITAKDPSGNTATTTFSVYVYESISGRKIRAELPSIVKVGEEVTVTLYATDGKDFDQVELTLDGKQLAATSKNTYKFTATEAKKYTLVATGRDNNGFVDIYEFSATAAELFKDTVNSGVYDEYLTFNDEIRLIDEMKSAVGKHTASEVYELFTNNIRYESYINSRKGAVGTFEQYGGNDVDQASLLIAALRYLGYPARYVTGKIKLTEAQAKELFGTDDLNVAAQILTNSTRNVVIQTVDDEKFIVMNHTWVEAYVPYSEISSDTTKADYGLWIELDTSIKPSIVTEKSTSNSTTQAEKTIVTNLLKEMESYSSEFEIIEDSAQNIYGNEAEVVKWYETTITKQTFEFLPSELPYEVENRTSTSAAVTLANSDTISFNVTDGFYSSYDLGTVKTAAIYGKRVTVSFIPANESSQNLLDQYNGDFSQISAQAMDMTPVLKIDGKVVKQNNCTVKLGTQMSMNLTIKTGGMTTTQTDKISAGSMYAIAIDLMRISGNEMEDAFNKAYSNAKSNENYGPYSDELLGAYLDSIGKLYFNQLDLTDFYLANLYNVNSARNTSIAVLGYEFITTENFMGTVTGVEPGKFFIDIDYNVGYSTSLDSNDENRKYHFFATSYISSYLESMIWQQALGAEAVSTIEVLAQSVESGIGLQMITSANYNDVIGNVNIDSSAISEIKKAVNNGYTVIVPEEEITINQWSGSGYIIIDVENAMSATYRITGGLSGGSTTETYDLAEKVSTVDLDQMVWDCYEICRAIAAVQMELALSDAVKLTMVSYTGSLGAAAVSAAIDTYSIMDSVNGAVQLYADSLNYLCDYILEGGSRETALKMVKLTIKATYDLQTSAISMLMGQAFDGVPGSAVPLLYQKLMSWGWDNIVDPLL